MTVAEKPPRSMFGKLHDLSHRPNQNRPVVTALFADLKTAMGFVAQFVTVDEWHPDPIHLGWSDGYGEGQGGRYVPTFRLKLGTRSVRFFFGNRSNGYSWTLECHPDEMYAVTRADPWHLRADSPETASVFAIGHLRNIRRHIIRQAVAVVRMALLRRTGFAPGLVHAFRDGDKLPWLVFADWCVENAPAWERYCRAVAEM